MAKIVFLLFWYNFQDCYVINMTMKDNKEDNH